MTNEYEYSSDGTSHAAPGYVLSRHVPPTRSDALQDDEVVDAGLGEFDRRADSGEAGADDDRVVDAISACQAAGSWVTSLTQLGTDGSSGRGYRSESQTIELASRWYGWRGLVTTPA